MKQPSELQTAIAKFIHEIRNPLTLVSSELQILASRHPETDNWEEISNIQDQLLYIKSLINEFSVYNHADRLSVKTVDLLLFLNDISNAFRPTLEYLGIQFITDFPSKLPLIQADTLRLRQAVTNLLRNAEESISHSQGKIIFSAKKIYCEEIPYIRISISDNGCGIASEYFADLGTPFVTHKDNGTGLGLSITRQITEAHEGIFKIESKVSQGTTAHLYLPVHRMIEQERQQETCQ